MNTQAKGTLIRADKGPIAPPPLLEAPLQLIVDAVTSWAGISATVHWYRLDQSQVDGVDFYWNEEELGHLHLDGSLHLATSPELGQALITEGVAKPFRYQTGWVEEQVARIGPDAAVALFRRHYEYLHRRATDV
jgi:Family of unknown function (DUF5519)